MIVRGFEMEKGVDYVDNFSPTPGLAVARLMIGTSSILLLEVPRQATRTSSMRSCGRCTVVVTKSSAQNQGRIF